MARKVAYNTCFGGFGLSEKAVQLARSISGDSKWAGIELPGELYPDGSGECPDWFKNFHPDHDFPRHDPVLIEVIEKLGDEASGDYAAIAIEEIEGRYRICEYDGSEWIETPESIDWVE